jgi:purine-binding chemotaxis protein CheW
VTDYVTVAVADQAFGIPVRLIHDVLPDQTLTPVPLAPAAIAGLLNLRGRVVTAIDLRGRLGAAPRASADDRYFVVVEQDGELHGLAVDGIGAVLSVAEDQIGRVPAQLDPAWREIATGVYPAADGLVVLIDIRSLLALGAQRRAAS